MKTIGTIIAFLILAALLAGLGYGGFTGYEFLSARWQRLNPDWQALLSVSAAFIFFTTLFASWSVQSSMRKYGLKGTGKVMAYNDFAHWYSAYKSQNEQALQTEMLKTVINQMLLWGSRQVARQARLLYEVLQKEGADREQALTKAEHVYIEIRRELGLSGNSARNALF